jgi:ribosomal protein L12E/L44/L45/RPP1/RPP2
VPLLGQAEKAELEKLILERFEALYGREGGSALLHPELRVVVNARGVELDHGEARDPLAAVEVKNLFTALCYATGGTAALPKEALESLATEATSAAAAAINRYSPPA